MRENEDEKELAEKIYHSFKEQVLPHFQHDLLNPIVQPRKFYICFKQAESWEKFSHLLDVLSGESLSPIEANHVLFWKAIIHSISRIHPELAKDKPSEIRALAKEHLRALYEQGKIRLQQNSNDFLTHPNNNNPKFISFIRELGFAWQKLWVFREWPDVPLNSSKIYVKVFPPLSDRNFNIEEYVDYSNKCIVAIKEGELYCKPKPVGVENFMFCLPKKMEVVQEAYGFSHFTIVSDGGNHTNSEITAQAEKLHRITLAALDCMNDKLANEIQDDKMTRYVPIIS